MLDCCYFPPPARVHRETRVPFLDRRSIIAAPMATCSLAFAPIATKVGVGTQKTDTDRCPKVGHCCSVPSPARVLWETMADLTIPCRISAVHIGNGSWALYKANHICGLD